MHSLEFVQEKKFVSVIQKMGKRYYIQLPQKHVNENLERVQKLNQDQKEIIVTYREALED